MLTLLHGRCTRRPGACTDLMSPHPGGGALVRILKSADICSMPGCKQSRTSNLWHLMETPLRSPTGSRTSTPATAIGRWPESCCSPTAMRPTSWPTSSTRTACRRSTRLPSAMSRSAAMRAPDSGNRQPNQLRRRTGFARGGYWDHRLSRRVDPGATFRCLGKRLDQQTLTATDTQQPLLARFQLRPEQPGVSFYQCVRWPGGRTDCRREIVANSRGHAGKQSDVAGG